MHWVCSVCTGCIAGSHADGAATRDAEVRVGATVPEICPDACMCTGRCDSYDLPIRRWVTLAAAAMVLVVVGVSDTDTGKVNG